VKVWVPLFKCSSMQIVVDVRICIT
jgi:hypothetical protein